jgi:hypothetical protein
MGDRTQYSNDLPDSDGFWWCGWWHSGGRWYEEISEYGVTENGVMEWACSQEGMDYVTIRNTYPNVFYAKAVPPPAPARNPEGEQ